jgi:hypothetical protein
LFDVEHIDPRRTRGADDLEPTADGVSEDLEREALALREFRRVAGAGERQDAEDADVRARAGQLAQ